MSGPAEEDLIERSDLSFVSIVFPFLFQFSPPPAQRATSPEVGEDEG